MSSDIKRLEGRVLSRIEVSGDCVKFHSGANVYALAHEQMCCENVELAEVHGDWEDLVGTEILSAACRENQSDVGDRSQTWTFYRITTIKGAVTMRWLGESSGYYSESVHFYENSQGPY